MIPLTIREVTVADVPSVTTLVTTVLAEFGLSFGEGSTTDAQVLELPRSYTAGGGCFWIATDATGALFGCCGVYPVAEATFELRKMYLHPNARGRGVGKALLDAAVAWARAHGGRRLVLDTIEEMTRAIGFYEANGFVRDDAQVRGSRCTRGYVRELG